MNENNISSELQSLEEEVIATNTYKSNYTGIILTKPIEDEAAAYIFNLLYITKNNSYLICRNTEKVTVEIEPVAINEEAKELAKIEKANTTYKYINQYVLNKLTTNGTYIDAEVEAKEITKNLLQSITTLNNNNTERIAVINRNKVVEITTKITEVEAEAETTEIVESVDNIKLLFNNIGKSVDSLGRVTERMARRGLADFLSYYYGAMLRANSHEVYILDTTKKAYMEVERDYLITDLAKVLKQFNLIHSKDLDNSLDFISNRLHPTHNMVKFNNVVYSMETHEVVQLEKPLFTLVEVPYNYNPKAKSKYMKDYLNTSFKENTVEETEKIVKGVKQLIGYLLTSGNRLTTLIFITGVSGAGKSVFTKVLTAMVNSKTSDIQLQDMEKEHMTSGLVGSHLNIAMDTSNRPIYDNGIIKKVTGNDPVGINPKGQTPYSLHPNEVPKNIVVCNNTPVFTNLENAILERLIYIHFKHKVRGTEKDDPNLEDKLLQAEEMEWLIYESLQAYKEMVDNDEKFILRQDLEATRKMAEKTSKPINYLLSEVILKYDETAFNTELQEATTQQERDDCYTLANELNHVLVYLAEKEGLELKLDKRGLISSRTLTNAIKYEYGIEDTVEEKYTTKVQRLSYYNSSKRVYPNLIKTTKYEEIVEEMSKKGYDFSN